MKLYKYLLIALVAVFSIGLTGCGDDITEQYYTGADTESYEFTVNRTGSTNVWTWNPNRLRYECEFSFPELAEDVFTYGAVLGYMYAQEGSVLTQKILPYVETYPDGDTYEYTETYGFDISLNPKTILFYMQASDLSNANQYLATTKFKVTLIWRI